MSVDIFAYRLVGGSTYCSGGTGDAMAVALVAVVEIVVRQ